MLLNILRQFNWIDIVVLILLFRMTYIAIKNGLPIELFKLLGIISAIYLSMHYYILCSAYLKERAVIKNIPLEFLTFLSFIVLAILGYLIFIILRKVFYRFINVEPVQRLNKWGGFIVGIARGILVISLLMFISVISNINYLNNSVKNAYLGRRIFKVAPAIYSALWNNLACKFRTTETFNKTILEVQSFDSTSPLD